MSTYWRSDLLLAAIGLLTSSTITLLVEGRRRSTTASFSFPPEPVFTACFLCIYASVAYPGVAVMATLTGARRPGWLYLMTVLALSFAHFGITKFYKGIVLAHHEATMPHKLHFMKDGLRSPSVDDVLSKEVQRSSRIRAVFPFDVRAAPAITALSAALDDRATRHPSTTELITSPEAADWFAIETDASLFVGTHKDSSDWTKWDLVSVARQGDQLVAALSNWVDNQLEAVGQRSRLSTCRVDVSTSPAEYSKLILLAEAEAKRIDRIPKRISVVFKDADTVLAIAESRFGKGSSNIVHYVAEHESRRQAFFSSLMRGTICREIYNIEELEGYVRSRMHGQNVVLSQKEMATTLHRWVSTIINEPNYLVALTRDRVPLKYEIIDSRAVVMHEAIGSADRHRFNALCVWSAEVANKVREDFEVVWDRTEPRNRDSEFVASWIQSELLPLTQQSA
jgi:hypothetical protein